MKVGSRVIALCDDDLEEVRIFGYGVYEGDYVPPPGISFMGVDLNALGKLNPRILLDDGEYVWGCECWWSPEEDAEKILRGRKVRVVSIRSLRRMAQDPERN